MDITEITGQLEEKLGDLSESEQTDILRKIFGKVGGVAALNLMEKGSDSLSEYIDKTGKLGKAQKMADARMKGFEGAMEKLGGAVETLKIKVGRKLLPILGKFVDWISEEAVPWLEKNLVPAVKKAADWMGENLPKAAAKIKAWWDSEGEEFFSNMTTALGDIAGDVKDLAGAIGELIGAFNTLTGKDAQEDQTSFWDLLALGIKNTLMPLRVILGYWQFMIDKWTWIIEHAAALKDAVSFSVSIPDVNPFDGKAAGGFTRRATGGWTMVGEHGPELINNAGYVKPHSASMGGGGGHTFNISGALDPVGTARQIRNILAKGDRASGRGALGPA